MTSPEVEVSLEIPPKPNSQLIKLIEQTGIKGIVPDVVKGNNEPLD